MNFSGIMQSKQNQWILYAVIALASIITLGFIGSFIVTGATVLVKVILITLGTIGSVKLAEMLLHKNQAYSVKTYLIVGVMVFTAFLFAGALNPYLQTFGIQGFSTINPILGSP